ncbi:MAG: hypothetical protein KKD86_08855 [Bacteroidetes bacterium]|nr:hypothetical protein [Bacteroidota bacterium]MBU1678949.1 hypothetical protein [Bacteroidota bacterium]
MIIEENRPETIVIDYKFIFDDKTEKIFSINIDTANYDLIRTFRDVPQDWTKLEKFQCPNCPLNFEEYEFCPVAINLQDILEFFSDVPSYEKVNLAVTTRERTYMKDTSIQQGISSILGIIMVTSGCPVIGKLKPMVRFHLPFASIEETEIKVFSLYLLAQLVNAQLGKEQDWEMKKLNEIYKEIREVNVNIAQKIVDLEKLDATTNAVIVLNNFADSVTLSLEEKDLTPLIPFLKEFL